MRTITTKLTRIYLIVAVSVLFCTGLISLLYFYNHVRAIAHDNLNTQAVAMAGNLESPVAFRDVAFAQQTLKALQHYPDVRMAAVVMADGKYFAKYSPDTDTDIDSLQQFPLQGEFITVNTHGVVQDITFPGKTPARLVVVASLEQINRKMVLVVGMSIAIGGLILLVAFIMFRHMSRLVTRPIEDLTAIMRKVERDGDHSQRVRIFSDDEIGELAKGFNAMLSVLERQNTSLNTELDERKSIQRKLDRLAHYDTVTRLPNRHYFQERLLIAVEHNIRLSKLMAVLFVDLDNFKLVNDSYGHHTGDHLLRIAAERLSSSLRAGDVVCRLGGDEFAIILEHLSDSQQIETIVDKLIQNLSQPLRLDDHDVVVTGSVGVAVCPQDADNPESLLRFADAAMYAAKAAGKNTWRRFDPEMASQPALRLSLENQLRVALAERQFEVHYQPQINMNTDAVDGFEALARWNHPDHGYISPLQFIPVAEECGLIRPLGEWVLRTACRQIVAWSLDGHERLKVAVNVSVRQLVHPHFVEQVLAILAETGCAAHQLDLEITESILMQYSDKTFSLLQRLRDHGIGIVIDDFGTGYSSMAQLKNMPVTKLKIDKSFVDDITTSHSDLAITATIASLARNLRIQIIAEGVESNQQVLLLRQSGCHAFQGYHFAQPLLATQIPKFIDGFHHRQQALRSLSADGNVKLAGWEAWLALPARKPGYLNC
ncbi:MAG: EAL domain-containing protein [Rhodoferax sp.]|nr:EAL domain-containing protein [Rhodoferax sp.]